MSVEVKDSVTVPESLDLNFFGEVLESALFESGLPIQKVFINMGSAVGENFCSQIYRARISYQGTEKNDEELSVIIKSIPISVEMKFLTDLEVYLKEKIFYEHVLPRMEVFLDNSKLGPRLYYAVKQPINTLVFEDLGELGYVMRERQKGLDLQHCLLVMKKIAQFHATSMILHKRDPQSMKSFHSGVLSEASLCGSDMFVTVFRYCLDAVIKYVGRWEGYESITEKLKNYANNFKENLLKAQRPIDGEIKVLCHGDLWVNNFLFKYKNKETMETVEDVVFLDLQMSVFGSPGIDLNYFFYTSMHLDVLMEKRDELLRAYYKSLCDTLNSVSFKDVPSYEDILEEVRRREIVGFFVNFAVFPGISIDASASTDNTFENFLDQDFADKKADSMFASQRVRDQMKYTLKRFDELGLMD